MQQVFNVEFEKLGLSFALNSVAFHIGNTPIKFYGIIFSLSCLLGTIYVISRANTFNINKGNLLDTIIVSLCFGMIGARVYYVIFYPGDKFLKNPLSILYVNEGGLAVYGGIITAILMGTIVCRIKQIDILSALDLASLGLLIGQAIGRWGNFFNQEAFGTPTDLPWAMKSEATRGVGVHPCFFYESLWCFVGFIFLHLLSLRFRKYFGRIFFFYLIWYGFGRLCIESLRTDSLVVPGLEWLRVSQLVSVFCIFYGIISILIFKKRALEGPNIRGKRMKKKYS
ncbi:MAG: prolipoprotein diacylglyceryl transferase [Oscillospiraceae bacterium]|nr:prolipoprotein diacylglyceryl transferase [Oscillospiraceae bacterium]